jgi:myo-inositol-1(or 4)-monophosphatase
VIGVPARELQAVACEAAELAGRQLLSHFRSTTEVLYTKERRTDVVSHADLAAEETLVRFLAERRPDDGFLGEESGSHTGSSGLRWVVDPLDGTSNFVRGIPHWAVSVACESRGVAITGVVHDPLRSETFAATRGSGPTLNARPYRPQLAKPLSKSMIIATLGHSRIVDVSRQSRLAAALYARAGQVRTTGSVALDLAWVAIGRVDACYHEDWPQPWDIAAGILLCEAAGLVAVRLDPAPDGLSDRVLAASPALAEELKAILGEHSAT